MSVKVSQKFSASLMKTRRKIIGLYFSLRFYLTPYHNFSIKFLLRQTQNVSYWTFLQHNSKQMMKPITSSTETLLMFALKFPFLLNSFKSILFLNCRYHKTILNYYFLLCFHDYCFQSGINKNFLWGFTFIVSSLGWKCHFIRLQCLCT
jgi:hypothetical protein